MSHRPRTRLLLLTAAVSALALMPPAHADGIRFTYSANQGAYSTVHTLGASGLEPVLGPVTLDGSVNFRPSARYFKITIDDAVVLQGLSVPVGLWQQIGRNLVHSEFCVPVGEPYRIAVAAKAEIWLLMRGAAPDAWQPCGAPATAGTAEIAWG